MLRAIELNDTFTPTQIIRRALSLLARHRHESLPMLICREWLAHYAEPVQVLLELETMECLCDVSDVYNIPIDPTYSLIPSRRELVAATGEDK